MATQAPKVALFSWPQNPQPICCSHWEFAEAAPDVCPNSNFLKGVKWSPDGACCLTAGDDRILRVFDLPRDALERPPESLDSGGANGTDPSKQQQHQHKAQKLGSSAAQQRQRRRRCGGDTVVQQQPAPPDSLSSALQVHAGEAVYDYAWFPGMSTADPASCCFASTTRGHPIHLWDACSGDLRSSYSAHDDADAPTAAYCLAFSPDGARLLGGYARGFRIFDVTRPGRDCRTVTTQRRGREGSMAGIISCLAFNPPSSDLLAVGAYSGAVSLFDGRTESQQLLLMEGHRGGVTQVLFGRDGNYLYSGARRDGAIICWDVRATGAPVYRISRDSETTNQRIQFDVDPCGRHLASGGADGTVRVFDLTDGSEVGRFTAATDTVNGCAFHPVMGLPLLATASGHRRYPLAPETDSDSSDTGSEGGYEEEDGKVTTGNGVEAPQFGLGAGSNALRLWRLAMEWIDYPEEPLGGEGGDAAMGAEKEEAGAWKTAESDVPLVRV